jgi:Uma2 family endonuclease
VIAVVEEYRSHSRIVKEQGATYTDYAAIPDEAGRFELLDGELLAMSPAPSAVHQLVSKELQKALYQCDNDYFVLDAPVDVILSQYSVLQPDIVMLRKDKLHLLTKRGIEGPPDVVVEILSPSTVQKDRGKKKDIYAHYGVPEYWIVDIGNELLEQYLHRDGKFELHHVYLGDEPVQSPNVPCIAFTMAEIMAEIPRLG